MKRVAEHVCFQTIGYLMNGFLKLRICYFDYDKAGLPGEENYFEKGVIETVFEGERIEFNGWKYPRIDKTRVNFIGVKESVLLIGLDKNDSEF